ncbi:MAG: response regulator [Lentisphaerae bacterium]|nr:response regulator [Lentisphaerota bacterium]
MEQKHRALIIDDERSITSLLAEDLEMRGYEPVTATTGREGVEAATRTAPAVALIDLLLDDMPGLAVMKEIKKACPFVECIMITGQAPERSAVAAAELGAYSYMMKPPNLELLAMTIRRAIEHGSLRRAVAGFEAALSAVMGSADGPMLVLDEAGTILAANDKAAERFGDGARTLKGALLADLVPADAAGSVRAAVEDAGRLYSPARAFLGDGSGRTEIVVSPAVSESRCDVIRLVAVEKEASGE